MQVDQRENLRQLIDSSTILTPAEKAEWLDMLVLMNDKQASELEQILNAKQAVPPTHTQGAVPLLTHISNLPSGVNAPSGSKPLPPPSPFVPPSIPLRPPAPTRPSVSARPVAPPVRPSQPPPPMPTRRRSIPAVQLGGPVTLETLSDVGKLTLPSMRGMAFPDFLIRMQQLSATEGYFNLLSYLEDSPLYKSYVNTGRDVLSGRLHFDQAGRVDPGTLTKEEFEAFNDILRKIQLN